MAGCDKNALISANDRKWQYFVGASAVIYFGGLVVVLIGRLFYTIVKKSTRRTRSVVDMNAALPKNPTSKKKVEEEEDASWYVALKEGAGALVSAQTLQGRILVVLAFISSLSACALYITESSFPVEHCLDVNDQILWRFEICLNIFFIFHFAIRFLAANDKLLFWALDFMSYVDFLTIPPVFVAIATNRNWIGLRFLRALELIKLAEILQFLNVLSTGSSVEMARIFGNFFALWLSSAGFVHLLENTGDFWPPINYENAQSLNYFQALYFLLVTMSTVGYGDQYAKTYLGQVFTMIFICVGLGLFASYIPAIIDFASSHTKYNRSFTPTPGRKHIIVCGHITEESVSMFVRDFLHPDREDAHVIIVFLGPTFPSISLQAILKKYSTRTAYFIGSIYNFRDCARIKMRDADAVIILCNKNCQDPTLEDTTNILRVISVKNYCEGMRCIVQLMNYKNKAHLLNCPQWNPKLGDDIVCIDELKLGFIAQSCHAPGFSTLLANLFAMRGDTISEEIHESEQWKVAYMKGSANEMYTATLSNSFNNLNFAQAAEVCFEKLHLMLIAIEIKPGEANRFFVINPSDKKLKIQSGTRGFFFAQDAEEVQRVAVYCSNCHRDLADVHKMKKCRCKNKNPSGGLMKVFKKKNQDAKVDLNPIALLDPPGATKSTRDLTEDIFANGEKPRFDSTGTFFWCEPVRNFMSVKMNRAEASEKQFRNHVVVLILNARYSPPLGLRGLVLPLRASNFHARELKKIVILGDGDYLMREWEDICYFPDIDVVPGSPYSRADLRAVNVNLADMVIILSPNLAKEEEHQALSDKESILITQNLKAMSFDKVETLLSDENENDGVNVEVLQANPVAMPTHIAEVAAQGSTKGANIPMITELVCDSNAMYLDQDDMNIYDDDGIYLTQPYACGSAFTMSVLDSLVSATYFNSDILTLVRNLVTGAISPELDTQMAEGVPIVGTLETQEIAASRNRCRVGQISLYDGPLSEFGECGLFGDLFLYALRTYNMICLGLYRFRDNSRHTTGVPSTKRYVITFPDFNFILAPTDLVFVLMQFDQAKQKKRKSIIINSKGSTATGITMRSGRNAGSMFF